MLLGMNISIWIHYFVFMTSLQECGKETDSKLYGAIRIPLCAECRENYINTIPEQKLVPKGRAKSQYGLSDEELKSLKYGFCTNPMNYNWSPMQLYWKLEIEDLARKKYFEFHFTEFF
jgi:hypothetical protein